jgi:hypothetical protein
MARSIIFQFKRQKLTGPIHTITTDKGQDVIDPGHFSIASDS